MERRHLLKRLFGTALAVLVVWHEDVLDYLAPKPITGTANVTLGSLVVEATGRIEGHATVHGVS